jgi:hypothetical protein
MAVNSGQLGGELEIELAPPRGHNYAIPLATVTTDTILISRQCYLRGWSLRENTGSADAHLEFYDGLDNTGTLLAAVDIVKATSDQANWTGGGIRCRIGLFVNVIAGSVRGAVFVRN